MLSLARLSTPLFSKLTFKVLAVPLALVLMLASFSLWSLKMGEDILMEEISDSTIGIANAFSTGIDRNLYLRYHEMHVICAGLVVKGALTESNMAYDAMPDPYGYMDGIDEAWVAAPLNVTTPFMESIIENNLSRNLTSRLDQHYEVEHGIDIYGEILVTNRYGAIVAMTARSSDFRQDDELWWQTAYAEDGCIGDVEFDESAGIYGVPVCIMIDDYAGEFAGVMKGFVDIVSVVREGGMVESAFEAMATKVLTSDGHKIYSSRAFEMMGDLSDEKFFTLAQGAEGYFIEEEGDRDRLFSYYRSTGYLTYPGHDWIVLVSIDAAEVLQPVADLRMNIMISAALLVGAGLVGSVLFARSISTPMRKLTIAASKLSEGDMDVRVGMDRDDEIGELARSFDHMAEEIGGLYHGLEDKVRERTEELEKANKKLNILGSVTRHDALNQMSVLRGWLDLARETVTNEVTNEYLDKVSVASVNIASYLLFTGEYEKIGVKNPEWRSLSESLVSSTYGLNLGGIEIVSKTSGVEVYADPMFPKVLRNLVVNSLKHGRSVTRVSVASEETADGLLIVYEDDGVGIPEDLKDSLFVRGKGHGLYLSSEILAITDITIREVGEPGKGVRFEINVPRSRYRSVEG
ncbi:MAG: HAMP domain-containing histidine kinase [Thermoplasmata archaeon]|nr:HAMP domain-containing histidine kinase [Thermoplasmata archaeon]